MNILALTPKALPTFPDIRSIAELVLSRTGVLLLDALQRQGTPMDVEAIAEAALKAIQSAAFKEMLATNGQILKAGGPGDARRATEARPAVHGGG